MALAFIFLLTIIKFCSILPLPIVAGTRFKLAFPRLCFLQNTDTKTVTYVGVPESEAFQRHQIPTPY